MTGRNRTGRPRTPAPRRPPPAPRRLAAAVALLVLAAAAVGVGGCADRSTGRTVTVLASWTGTEESAFRRLLDEFRREEGVEVAYQGTRALRQVLLSDVQKGTPPDVAVLPSPGELAAYLHQGLLRPLDRVIVADRLTAYGPQELHGRDASGADRLYAFGVKAGLKSLIWYSPSRLGQIGVSVPANPDWAGLMRLSADIRTRTAGSGAAPWCMGMNAPPTSGWPGTDWIENILLQRSGPQAYRDWSRGHLAWTSPQVRQAWTDWGAITAGPGMIQGGVNAALLTDFGDAAQSLTDDPPGCYLHHQASIITGRSVAGPAASGGAGARRPEADFTFLPFPSFGRPTSERGGTWEVSADLAAMFNDRPEVRRLMRFLATDRAQRIWAERSDGEVFSINADMSRYGAAGRKITTMVSTARALCFDASDLMPAAMTSAFHQAVLEYLRHPDQLDTLLAELDKIRAGVPAQDWLDLPCTA